MRAPTILVVLAAACFGFPGCSETVSGPDSAVPEGLAFDFLNGPEFPGQSHVFRFAADETWMLSTQSDEARLFTVYGDPTTQFFCGGAGNPEFSVQWNDVEHALNIVALKKDFTIYVYEYFNQFPPDFCAYLATNWAYRGTVSYNEVFHRNRETANRSWKWTTTGVVTDPDGNEYSYLEVQHLLRDANGSGGWITETIQVTPRGQ